MKSPNAKSSIQNLKVAKQLIRNAWEDLKNDPEIRDENLHTYLQLVENDLQKGLDRLKILGYF